ncbi:MAG: hypothetical protein NTW86_33135, partial [Candidatus Sumerlaeota bacterium]|nr:hypothetical protein [Candidatus Sumerlaeota bacterium]
MMITDATITRRSFLQRGGALALAAGLARGTHAASSGPGASGFEAALKKYPKLQPRPFGKGIFAHVKAVTGEMRHPPEVIQAWAEHPYVTGTQLSYCWTQLEPAEGECRWDIIEEHLDLWARNGKKCWLEVSTAGRWWRGTPCDPATPQWVFDQGAAFVKAPETATYPVFWDPRYLEKWGQFIH